MAVKNISLSWDVFFHIMKLPREERLEYMKEFKISKEKRTDIWKHKNKMIKIIDWKIKYVTIVYWNSNDRLTESWFKVDKKTSKILEKANKIIQK